LILRGGVILAPTAILPHARCVLDPRQPFLRRDAQDVGVVLSTGRAAFFTRHVALADGLGDGVLDGPDADAGLGGDRPDGQLAPAVKLHLASNNGQRRLFAERLLDADRPRHGRTAAETACPLP
jgi:hypothetical protein